MNIFMLLAVIALIVYGLKVRQFNRNWADYPEFRPDSYKNQIQVSVVIAFRNEAKNLDTLLNSLKKQHYTDSKVEFILVDDHSTDGSDILVRRFCEKKSNFRYISNEGKHQGKKSALKTGIKAASHELIVTTDADCQMNEHWLTVIASFFNEKQPDLIIGLVDMKAQKGFLQEFQEVEFLSLIASGAGSAADSKPVYCNGANMAFRKSLFMELADPFNDQITSGDDTFFLHALKRQERKIVLLKSKATVVHTLGETTIMGYLNQRIRWVSKSRHYHDRETIYLALLVLTVNFAIMSALGYLMITANIGPFIFLFAVKLLADFVFLRNFMHYFRKKLSIVRFLLYSLIYPFLVLFFTLAGLLWGFQWKGRSFKK
jgi:cellulose synthase/poly-beta-1,6-N-acetylglucosamine synthase-like glycosyltransferase